MGEGGEGMASVAINGESIALESGELALARKKYGNDAVKQAIVDSFVTELGDLLQ